MQLHYFLGVPGTSEVEQTSAFFPALGIEHESKASNALRSGCWSLASSPSSYSMASFLIIESADPNQEARFAVCVVR